MGASFIAPVVTVGAGAAAVKAGGGYFTSSEEPTTPEETAIIKKYGLDRGTPQQQAEATNRLARDAWEKTKPWRGSAVALKHPDWTEEQVRWEWMRYWHGPKAARDLYGPDPRP